MSEELPTSVVIGAQVLSQFGKGDTPEARFGNIIKPDNLSAGCWMTTKEDEQFRAAVGGLILSYQEDSPERERIQTEMRQINRLSAMLQSASLGMGIGEIPEPPQGYEPIGLLALWRNREKR